MFKPPIKIPFTPLYFVKYKTGKLYQIETLRTDIYVAEMDIFSRN